MADEIIFQEHTTESNYIIAQISLNNEPRLNALNLDNVNCLIEKLEEWQHHSSVKLIIIDSNVKKSFCAGGDIRKLYYYLLEENICHPEEYFKREYYLNYLLHTHSKPIICWANGITMGGGLGLMTGCNYRIVNDSTVLSMPEVHIGLYPDTGAAFFLGKIPKDIGLFIAITGCNLNGADAVYLGLADYFIDESFKEQFFSMLKHTDWRTEDVRHKVLQLVSELTHNSEGWAPYSKIRKYRELISNITKQPSLEAILSAIEALETNDSWLLEIKAKAKSASPLSQLITYNFFHDCSKLSLREILHCEVELSTKLVWEGDFFEGVRALLIERNRKPNWKSKNIKDINLNAYYNGIVESFTTWDIQPLIQEAEVES